MTNEIIPNSPEDLKQALEIHEKAYAIVKLRVEQSRRTVERAREALQEACPHTEVERDGKYYSGGYDYTAETIYTTKCLFCNKVLDIEHKSHSWYG